MSKTFTGNTLNKDVEFTFNAVFKSYQNTKGITTTISPDDAPQSGSKTISVTGDSGSNNIALNGFKLAGTYTYTVTEANSTESKLPDDSSIDYDAGSYTVTVVVTDNGGTLSAKTEIKKNNESGEPEGESLDTAAFANIFNPAPTSVEIPVSKTFTGNTLNKDVAFTFNAELKSYTDVAGKEYNSNSEAVDKIEDLDFAATVKKSSATVNVLSKAESGSDKFTIGQFTKAGTYTYTVTEVNSTKSTLPTGSSIDYDAGSYTVTVVVIDENGELKVQSTAYSYSDETANRSTEKAQFVNVYKPAPTTVTLSGSKTISGRNWNSANDDGKYSFTVGTAEDYGENVTLPTDPTVKNGADGTFSFSPITISAAGTYEFEITENDVTDVPGMTKDAGTYTVTVVVTDNGGTLVAGTPEYSYSDKTADKSTEKAQFVNVYKPAPTTVTLSGSKTISGRNWNSANDDGKYSFTVGTAEDYGENVTLPTDPTVKNGADGTFSFSPITISAAGTYKFEITENDVTDVPGMTKDAGSYTVTVEVTDNGGTLVAGTPEYSYSDKTTDRSTTEAQFVNVYKPAPATDIIKVNKKLTLDGEPQSLAGKSYTFTIEKVDGDCDPADGIVLPETKTAKFEVDSENEYAASATFDAITFNKAGNYKVKISEADPGDEIEKPDDIIVTYVVKDKDGQLVATPTYSRADRMFENKIRVKSDVVISKKQATTGEFTTDLLTVEAGATVEYQIKVTASGNVAAKNVVVTDVVPDGLALVNGSITEDGKLGEDGKTITWNIGTLATGEANQKTLSFKVTVPEVTETTTWDNVAAVTFKDNPEPKESDKVTVRENPPISVEIPVSKTFTGNTLKAPVTFTFNAELTSYQNTKGITTTISPDDAPQSGSMAFPLTGDSETDGTIALNGFKLAGTYEYTVTEETSANPAIPDKNIDYDTGRYTVSFTITEQDDGTLVHGPLSFTYSESGATRSTEKAEFVNTYKPLGDLTISKSVVDSNKQPTTDNTEFSFKVKLADTSFSGEITDDSDKTYQFVGGETTVTVKGGSFVTLKGLPVGEVTVTEQDIEGYTVDGNKEKSATIPENETGKVEFVNVKDAPLGDLTITKSVDVSDGDEFTGETFTFDVQLDDETFAGTVYDDLNNPYTFTEGKTTVEITMTSKDESSVTLHDLPVGGVTVTEQDIEGYTVDGNKEKSATIPDNGSVAVEFVNIKDAPLGDLTISKSVVDSDEQPITDTTEFSFKVKLADTSFNETVSGYKFENGETTVTVKGGSSVTLHGLPVGGVTVTEQDIEGYTVDGNKEKSATIPENETGTVKFVNIKDAPLGDLTISKSVVDSNGDDITDNTEFSFTVKLADTSFNETVSGYKFENGETTVTVKGGSSVTLKGLPVGGVTVTEQDIEGYTPKDGSEKTATIPEDGTGTVEFVNVKDAPLGNLTITKSVVDSDEQPTTDTTEFSFKVKLADTSFNETVSGYKFKNGETTVIVKGGSSVTLKGLPVGEVTVTEQDIEGYTPKDGSEKTATIPEDGTGTVEFVNIKDAPPLGHPDITIEKSQTDGEKYGELINVKTGDTVTYSITVKNIGDEKAENVTVTDVVPDGLIFAYGITESGTLGEDGKTITWTIPTLEVGAEKTLSFKVTVPTVVESKTWKNIATLVSYTDPNDDTPEEPNEPEPSNEVTLKYEPERGSLTVSKTVTGDHLASDSDIFKFTVTLSNGLGVATEINGVYGGMTFINGVATFTLSGGQSVKAERIPVGLTYTVTEVGEVDINGNLVADSGYTVTSPASGTATGNITSTGSTAAFINDKSAPPQPTGDLTVSKTVTGNAANFSDVFRFTVTLYNNGVQATDINGAYGEMIFTNGVATIDLMHQGSNTATGLPAGYTYTVTEDGVLDANGTPIPGSVGGLTGYRSSMADGGNGVIPQDAAANVVYTNIKATGKLTVSKAVSPGTSAPTAPTAFNALIQPIDLESFTFTVTLYNGSDVADINGTYGEMIFTNGVATFTLSGGDSKTATDIPAGLTYTVIENVYPEYDQYVGDATAPSTQNLVSSGVIPEGDDPAIAAFTNIKKQTPQPKGSLTLKKNVAVEGYTGNETFTFTVTLYNGLDVATDITGTYGDMIFTNGVATVELKNNEQKTATGIPAGYTYTVTETNPNGYIPDFGEQSINLFSGFDPYLLFDAAAPSKSGTITANSNETVVCNNTKPAPTLGDLKITKKVVDDDNNPITGGTFTFDVQLADAGFSGIVYDDSGKSYTFTAGHTTVEITVTSEGGNSVMLKGLPIGGVTVTEQDAEGYSVNGSKVWTETVKNGAEIEVLFTNTKLAPEITISKTQNGETKKLTVKAGDTVVYSLEVKNTGKANAEDVKVSDEIPDKLTLVEGSISDGGKLGEDGKTITWNIGALAPGANTTVSFKVTVPTVDEHTEWPNVGQVTYTDPNDPSKPDTPIESNEVVIESEPEPEVPEVKTGSLSLIKVVINQYGALISDARTFVFDIELVNSDFSGTLNGVTFTNGRGVAAVMAGQKLVIDGLPDGAEYKITERPTAGYLLRTDMSSGMWGYISENAEAEAWIYNMISTGNPPVIPPEIPPYEPENPPFIPDIDSPTEPNIIDDVEETDNPKTGLGLAPIFGAFAAAVAAISKRRKK